MASVISSMGATAGDGVVLSSLHGSARSPGAHRRNRGCGPPLRDQFPYSRAYLSSDLYEELETLLERMTGRHVLVGSSTTLCYLAALPVLVRDADAVIIDQFAHASLHLAAETLGATPVVRVRHSRLDELETRIEALAPKHARIWYVLDGLYSMRGDFAPFGGLRDLLVRYPQLHLNVDDAHATSVFGAQGCGHARGTAE
jgi:7-keto-8-aminopelargonate synthetase-like enzyme